MNKLPTKQIYLLFIIIVGIITLSVYSTYALFTFESTTDDIVSIHTPKSLKITENIYEYQQITAEPNKITTTDIDIYNDFDYEICYSIWYKILADIEIQNKVQIFEKTDEALKTSGVISPGTHLRITVVIINDNEEEIKINLGTIGAQKTENSCSLNLATDKNVITSSYKNLEILTTKILEEKDKINKIEENYLTYKDIEEKITFKSTDKIYASDKFKYENEIFTIDTEKELTFEEVIEENRLQINNIYFCKDRTKKCQILYKISKIEKEEIENKENPDEKLINYHIIKSEKMIGYSKGENGLRKVNTKDYVYYGDNPNNYIYYNCINNDDLNTCELWRIVGFFYNEKTKEYNPKIVRNESIGKYQYDYKIENEENKSSNNWIDSTLNKYLNEEYEFKNNYEIYIEEITQPLEKIPNLEIDVKNLKTKEEKIDSKITILNLSDYLNASSCEKTKINEYRDTCITNNWLNNIEIKEEWSLTSKEIEKLEELIEETNQEENVEEETSNENLENENTNEENLEIQEEDLVEENKYIVNYVYSIGNSINEKDVNDNIDVRPTIFLKSRMVLLEGEGTFERPYIIK